MFRHKTKHKKTLLAGFVFLVTASFILFNLNLPGRALALTTPGNGGGAGNNGGCSASSSSGVCTPNTCVAGDTACADSCATNDNDCDNSQCSSNNSSVLCDAIIQQYVNPILDFLGAGVGIIITIMLVVGGIQYAASGGDPNGVAAAKKRIANAIIALVTFGLLWAFLNWIIPNGVFS